MDNTDRLLAYLERSAPSHAADPKAFRARYDRGLRLQGRPFPWTAKPSNVLTLRKRRTA